MYAYIVPNKIQLLSMPEASVTCIHDASSNRYYLVSDILVLL